MYSVPSSEISQLVKYPGTSLLLIAPLKKLPLNRLTYVINVLSWLLVCLTAFFACRIFLFQLCGGSEANRDYSRLQYVLFYILWFYLTITFYPIVRSWRLGQVQTINNFLFAAALWSYMRGARTLPGVLSGLICLLKPHLGLLLIWGLLRRQWKFVLGFGCAAGCGLIVSLALYGPANHVDYVSVLSYISKHGESFHPNQSMNGLLNRLFFNGNNLVWDASSFPPYHAWVYAGTLLSAAVLILASLFIKTAKSRRTEETDTLEFMIAFLCFTMASPVAWEHHYGILLPMFAFVLPLALGPEPDKKLVAGLAAAYVLTSNYYQITDVLAGSLWNVFQSYLYGGALLLLLCLYFIRRSEGEKFERAKPG